MPQPPRTDDSAWEVTQADALPENHGGTFDCGGIKRPNGGFNDGKMSLQSVVDACIHDFRERLLVELSALQLDIQDQAKPCLTELSILSVGSSLTRSMKKAKPEKRASVANQDGDCEIEILPVEGDLAKPHYESSSNTLVNPYSSGDSAHSCDSPKTYSSGGPGGLWQVWVQDSLRHTRQSERTTKSITRILEADVVRTGDTIRDKGCCQKIILRPTSVPRIVWDTLSCIFMAYDIVLVPMMVFDLPEDTFLKSMALIIACFWTVDLLFTFFVGFHDGGIVEMRPIQIAARYLKTWFMLDLAVVCCDWFSLAQVVSADSVGAVRTSKTLKIIRVFRLMRFLRVWSIVHMLSECSDFVNSENLMQFLGILKFIIVILVVNHYVACAWYALAEFYPGGTQTTWIGELERRHDQPSIAFQYTTSLHWSFTQFTPASMEVTPRNGWERAFSVIVLLSGMVVFSSFVSGITSAMTRVRENNKERNRHQEELRQYITENKISLELGRRIYSYLKSRRVLQKTRILEEEVSVFKMLPTHILVDLHAELFIPPLSQHPLFHQFLIADEFGLIEVCHASMGEFAVAKGQPVFMRDERATRMVTNRDGSLAFIAEGMPPAEFLEGAFFCEVVLWLRWQHRAKLEATSFCVLIEVRAVDFHNVLPKTNSFKSCQMYAQQFAQKFGGLNATDQITRPSFGSHNSPTLTDQWQDFDVSQEMAQVAFENQLDEPASQISKLGKLKAFGGSGGFRRRLGTMLHIFVHGRNR